MSFDEIKFWKLLSSTAGCVVSVEIITILIENSNKCVNHSDFFCRNCYFSIPVLSMVDSNYLFHNIYAFLTNQYLILGSSLSTLNMGRFRLSGTLQWIFSVADHEPYIWQRTSTFRFGKRCGFRTPKHSIFQSSYQMDV